MKYLVFIVGLFFFTIHSYTQSYHTEIGVEIQAASFSTHGGTFGGALKFAIVEEETVTFGPSLRYQYMFSKNHTMGTSGKSSTIGGGAFFHYRFLEWFFLGTEVELLQNPFVFKNPDKKWRLTAFLGGGISKSFGPVRLNVGILYDVVDGFRDPYTTDPSPLSRDYFFKIQNPDNPGAAKYLPIIYRIAFFFPLNNN